MKVDLQNRLKLLPEIQNGAIKLILTNIICNASFAGIS